RRLNPKCLGKSVPDTFSARSAHLTGLKMRRITRAASFDHLVGAGEQCRRHRKAECLRRDQIDDEIELGRLLDRKVGGLRSAKDLVDQLSGAAELVREIWSVGHESPGLDKVASTEDCRLLRAERQRKDASAATRASCAT